MDPDSDSAVPDTALRLDAISPLAGPSGGGIPLILRGKNIAPGAEVRGAGALATNAIFRWPGELRATLPAGPGVIGPVPIEIGDPDGETTVRPDLFAYDSLLEKTLGVQDERIVDCKRSGAAKDVITSGGRFATPVPRQAGVPSPLVTVGD